MQKTDIHLYFTKESLYAFFSQYNKIQKEGADESMENIAHNDKVLFANQLYKLVMSESRIFLNINKANLLAIINTNPENSEAATFKKLVKSPKKVTCQEDAEYISLTSNESPYPHTIYVLNKNNEDCDKLANEYGMIFLNKDTIWQKMNLLFSSSYWAVTGKTEIERRFTNWADIQPFKTPCNALILFDNYLLGNDDGDNLFSLLKNVLPSNCSKYPFHLTIIMENDKNDRRDIKTKPYFERHVNKINEFLTKTFSYRVEFSLIVVKKGNHDRNILTNYVWLHSGSSFDFLDKKGKIKNTTETQLILTPITTHGVKEMFHSLKNAALKNQDKKENEHVKQFVFSTSENFHNRLLS